ncbi:protein-methionine-sulfoxide reductase catalytic subunit MsrP [Azospirillum sp. RWY-5-1]|uniref:Protein-methionine-sulfoxide reductase catalytic subunit MsrP n=1 Tax=Azospirillum oleiclasticum TaxID=2735135 RepID=A0ABX2TG79_9PROT|nr:protein-methionine-sulfoxide reductase catalytic subunit MsrP [Azospirillum oleiclasticum]NYZ16744.1 protein-methionine-sulfoxide reductase catalytic subunit MsrP [Azospirillum oleiclasticum]NYZ23354.1 protein-methionine-sulfoxide reductase catalytic subunit MsrP [Azospirillum oleiclasticum]
MLIRRNRGWELPERAATPESVWMGRRALLAGAGATILAGGLLPKGALAADAPADPSAGLYPVARNAAFTLDRAVTDESLATTYNNFVEFGSQKSIWRAAQKLPVRPWAVVIDGMVEQPVTVDIDQLLARMPLEERLYRHRCVEAWAMAVPWSGFPLKALLDMAKPLSSARYVRMETFKNDKVASGQKQFWYPWPYVEGLTVAEAANELAFIATGLYGKPIPPQNGAPLRLVLPWKYGFKSIKSIARITLTDQRPVSFWESIQASEYGFWANVNPDVPHPRWSQKTERLLGSDARVPTQLFNGYGAYVADLYKGLEGEKLYV